ncbi:MAG: class I SAM-dependent methyltransferase [Candidatus Dormibacteraeota bacterium]|nr:class I SAM-dependent methyltransferase [Candidatus Dormibacteraeota bacterium]
MLVVVSLLNAVRSARRKLADAGPVRTRAAGDFELVALPEEDGDTLRDLLLAEQATVVIEVGLAYGSSALAIAEALVAGERAGARHLIIDAFQHLFHDAGWEAMAPARDAGLSTLLRERSQLVLPRLLSEGLVADAAFVDGSHIFHNVFVDLYFLREIVRPGGLLVLDDYQWPSVATAVRYFQLNTGWTPVPAGRPTRLRAFRLPDPRAEPSFQDFKPFQSEEDPR